MAKSSGKYNNFDFIIDKTGDKYVDIGNLIRNARTAMDVDISEMSKLLKMRPEYIEMVEGGDYENVSKKIYYFGYVRHIARYLNLDDEAIIAYLIDEDGGNGDSKDRRNVNDNLIAKIVASSVDESKTKIGKPVAIALVAISAMLVMLYLVQLKERTSVKISPSATIITQ